MKRVSWMMTTPLATVLGLGMAALPAGATTVLEHSNQDLSRVADVITVGQASRVESTRADGQMMTRVTISVSDTWKGSTGSQLSLLIPGGVDTSGKHPIMTTYPGSPQILPGQEVLLFLVNTHTDRDPYRIVGFSQGVFWVSRQHDGEARVSRDLSEMRLLGPDGAKRGAGDASSLESLHQEVLGYLSEGGGR